MLLHFTKMHGLGNDFMVVDLVTQRARLTDEVIAQLADRRFGIGFDQLLVVEPPRDPDMDFRYRIFNADGSEVENCGNGARCFARFVREQRLTHKHEIRVETAGGPLTLHVQNDGEVRVDMGRPRFEPAALPFDAQEDAVRHAIEVDGEQLEIGAVSMGNPHAVLTV
ncbi:diaminopimelate epimerase, partial [Halomonas sp. 707D4]